LGYASFAFILSLLGQVETTVDWYKNVATFMTLGVLITTFFLNFDHFVGFLGGLGHLVPKGPTTVVIPEPVTPTPATPDTPAVQVIVPNEVVVFKEYNELTEMLKKMKEVNDTDGITMCGTLQKHLLDFYHDQNLKVFTTP
jgi:hypothetical protein